MAGGYLTPSSNTKKPKGPRRPMGGKRRTPSKRSPVQHALAGAR